MLSERHDDSQNAEKPGAGSEPISAPPMNATEFEKALWRVRHKPNGELRDVFRENT